jgi:hypothetical protein
LPCLSSWAAALLAPRRRIRPHPRPRHKDGTYDEDAYRVGLAGAAYKRIVALPREARHLAFLWDDDLLVVLPVDKLKELKSPNIKLAPMDPAK